jgi:type II secretory pathway component GspD/PulD (secretin)
MAKAKIFFLILFLVAFSAFSSYAREPDIIAQLREDFPDAIISFDAATNTMVITAIPEEQQKIAEMLKILDTLPPQIAIEARFIEFIVTDTGELGGELELLNLALKDVARDATVDIIVSWALGVTPFPVDAAAGIIQLLHEPVLGADPKAIIRALAKVGAIEVISAPRVVTLSGHPAEIKLLAKVPYLTEVTFVEGVPEFPPPSEKDAGIFLEVTPTAIEGGALITMEIKPTVRFLVKRVPGVPGVPADFAHPIIDERKTRTHAIIESGGTIVLGGLIGREERVMDRKMPLLGDIPVLGQLFFRHRYHLDEKRKLLIFLTAHLVDPWGEVAVARRY